eukprot:CAMPEP_0177651930 /NCGR_PEP_ID=MMETSP0447-20121125/12828_1 /TAXON_ID=0 /ORGANISM="Stygamoeba regulata, Strain BSH-02190019" /LENGTH=430 /DNA_ID=CAMNT_0019155079 /DNA_START=91 /DNA_END=1383 /DNA_ORIENTATION=-
MNSSNASAHVGGKVKTKEKEKEREKGEKDSIPEGMRTPEGKEKKGEKDVKLKEKDRRKNQELVELYARSYPSVILSTRPGRSESVGFTTLSLEEKAKIDIQKISDLAIYLESTVDDMKQGIQEQYDQLQRSKHIFEEEKRKMSEQFPIEETILELNVSGKKFTSYKATLCKVDGSMLEAMFSGRHRTVKDKKGRFFIDRPAKPFRTILQYLQTGTVVPPHDEADMQQLMIEIEYFGLDYSSDLQVLCHRFLGTQLLAYEQQKLLSRFYGDTKMRWVLCYKASRDGFRAADFHRKCDKVGPTIAVIQSKEGGYLFGGYTSLSWKSSQRQPKDPHAFVFSLTNPSNQPVKMDKPGPQSEKFIVDRPDYGPTYGGGHDLYIADNSNTNNQSHANIGHSFLLEGFVYGTQNTRHFLTGATNFMIDEIEVFQMKV